MLDPNFDPYDELMVARHNIGELIKALNHQHEISQVLQQQNEQLLSRYRDLQRRVHLLEMENLQRRLVK